MGEGEEEDVAGCDAEEGGLKSFVWLAAYMKVVNHSANALEYHTYSTPAATYFFAANLPISGLDSY